MLLLKVFHIILVVGWFAGLFYLPRIFVNMAMECHEGVYERLLLMAKKALYCFSSILMIPALFSGAYLWKRYGIGDGSKMDLPEINCFWYDSIVSVLLRFFVKEV